MGLYQIIRLLSALINFYEWLVIIWALMTWFPIQEGTLIGDIANVINRLVAPYVNLFRRIIPPLGGIDFSAAIALFVLYAVERIGIPLLYKLL